MTATPPSSVSTPAALAHPGAGDPAQALLARVGQVLGVSDWILVDQSRIDTFAACTEDAQWIHVDPVRAARESPFGATVAHGFLSLSLLAPTAFSVFLQGLPLRQAINYGLDRVRFMTPVRVGRRVRNHIRLLSVEARPDGAWMVRTENTVEIEGEARPALVAVSLGLLVFAD